MKRIRLVSIDASRAVCEVSIESALDAAESPHWRIDDALATVSRHAMRDVDPWQGTSVTVLRTDGSQRLSRSTASMSDPADYERTLAIIADLARAVAREGLSIHSHSTAPFVSASVFSPPPGTSGAGQWWGHLLDDNGDRVIHSGIGYTRDMGAADALGRLCDPYGISFSESSLAWRDAGRGETCGHYVARVVDERDPIEVRLADLWQAPESIPER